MKRWLLLLLLVFPLFASADVTFYSKCDYKGPGVALAPGDYTAAEMLQFGITQDSISAVDVPRGLTVTLYEDDRFRGRYGTLKRSDPCLENDRFDDVVSSISIRESFTVTNPALTEVSRASAGVTVFAECNFKGGSAILGEGDYNRAQLEKLGIANNDVSSIKVAEGYSVTVFDNDFLLGQSGSLQQDHDCLARDNFDDLVSSLSVVRTAEAVARKIEPAAVPTSAITVFTECNYLGDATNLNEGEFTTARLQELGLENNSISSIRVTDGFQVELFENDFYLGSSGVLRQNDDCLVDDRFSDTISSLIVSADPRAVKQAEASGAATDNRVGVTVFGHCNYKGGSINLRVGSYDANALAAIGVTDNVISSFKLEKGFQVTVYDAPDFSGRAVKFANSDNCLNNERLDDKVSSLVVEPLKVTKSSLNLEQFDKPDVNARAPDSTAFREALECVQQYAVNELCESHRWDVISQRCGLDTIELMTDGYLKGHVDAGNCKAEFWDELSRRIANPRLR